MKKKLVALIVAITLMAGIGCADDRSDGQYHFGGIYTTEWPMLVPEMITACQLTPADTLMVDLTGGKFIDLAGGQTCGMIRGILGTYRQAFGYDPDSLLFNPALTSSPPSLQGLQYALIRVEGPLGGSGRPIGLPEILVDLVHNKLAPDPRYGGYALRYHPDDPSLPDLTVDDEDEFLDALQPILTWGDSWVEVEPGLLDVYNWTIAIATADSQIYRWQGFMVDPNNKPATSLVPPGLVTVCNAFWDLVGQ